MFVDEEASMLKTLGIRYENEQFWAPDEFYFGIYLSMKGLLSEVDFGCVTYDNWYKSPIIKHFEKPPTVGLLHYFRSNGCLFARKFK